MPPPTDEGKKNLTTFPYNQLSPPATGVCDGHAGDNGGGGCQGIAWPSQKDMQFPDRTPDYAFACPWGATDRRRKKGDIDFRAGVN
ncbi:hypothetical protein FACS1894110_19790 [Spirochaetia bacterium]|nr:hypothetical protein FACS1894110_19790 [Spirochaetia bacterium]